MARGTALRDPSSSPFANATVVQGRQDDKKLSGIWNLETYAYRREV